MEMGNDTTALQRRYPEITKAYGLYTASRIRTIVVANLPIKGKDGSTKVVIVPFTTGYGPLPEAGGLMDQPHRLMEFWDLFLQGDRAATFKSLS